MPEGYKNKLHFALKNSKGEKAKSLFTGRRKLIMVGLSAACGLILIVSSLSAINDGGLMMKQEAMEAPMMESMDMVEEAAMEEPAEAAPMEKSEESNGRAADEEVLAMEAAEEETNDGTYASGSDSVDCICSIGINGDSIVIHLDVEDVEAVYQTLHDEINPIDPKPTWALHTYEPEEYLAIRELNTLETISTLADKIIREYGEQVDSYYTARVEYENIDTEMVGLQEHGYLFIVIK